MKPERVYTVNETFDVLKANKITSNIESVRRWLRQGELEGIAPTSRKEGWKVTQTALNAFLTERLPDAALSSIRLPSNATNDVKESPSHTFEIEQVRAEMWYEITRKNIWEGFIIINKTLIREAAEHRGYSYDLMNEVWERCIANSSAYKQPRVSYLLNAFSFEGKRLLMDSNFASKEEQIIYAILEHVKKLSN